MKFNLRNDWLRTIQADQRKICDWESLGRKWKDFKKYRTKPIGWFRSSKGGKAVKSFIYQSYDVNFNPGAELVYLSTLRKLCVHQYHWIRADQSLLSLYGDEDERRIEWVMYAAPKLEYFLWWVLGAKLFGWVWSEENRRKHHQRGGTGSWSM